jgi:hypothetical protein
MRELVSSARRAHPGLHVEIEDQVAEEDRVVTRWLATTIEPGGEPAGLPRYVSCCAGISIIRLLAGKQVDSRTECVIPVLLATLSSAFADQGRARSTAVAGTSSSSGLPAWSSPPTMRSLSE